MLNVEVKPDWEALVRCIERKGTPERVHHIELFLDPEVQQAVTERFGLASGLDPDDPAYPWQLQIRIQRFLGYDYVRCGADPFDMPLKYDHTEDEASEGGLQRASGRSFVDEHSGPITNWEEFERYPWPDPDDVTTRALEWYEENLPDDMCVIGSGGFAHFAEFLTWLMGYETCCVALCTERDLVKAISDRLVAFYDVIVEKILAFDRVKLLWGSDDMGFVMGPLLPPDDLREFVLPGHKRMAAAAHRKGMPYLLHACGNLETIMEDLIEDVRIDAKHSFEDTIEDVRQRKEDYGDRIAILGGIDMDFLCRRDEDAVRARVRDTLEKCMPGGGYVLGTGNSVANYVPLNNYLAMLDEGRRFTP